MGVFKVSQIGDTNLFISLSKQFLCFLLLIGLTWFSSASAQPSYHIDAEELTEGQSLSLEALDTWQYKPDNDSDRTYKDIESENWESVSLSLDTDELPDNWQGNGWFRTAFHIDSSLYGKEMGIWGRIYGAMEIYLNGKLVGKAGMIGYDADSEESTGNIEPIIFRLDKAEEQQLAIRYSNHNYKKGWGKSVSGPLLELQSADDALLAYERWWEQENKNSNFFYFQLGFYFVLAFLHGFLFLFYPEERTNLIFSALMAVFFLTILNINSITYNHIPERFIQYLKWEGIFSAALFAPLAIILMHQLVYKKLQTWTWILTGAGVIVGLSSWFDPFELRWLYLFYFLFSFVEILRALIVGLRKGNQKLWIIVAGFLAAIIISTPRILYIATSSLNILWADWMISPYVGLSAIPLSFSVYLAYDFSQLHKKVRQQLKENETLAEEKLVAEREKQQLIQSQKQELEKKVQERTADLQESLKELQAAQEQLVQQEKLASLGQLTAGIAHEIKNPLNFVNNFSDLSVELVEEAREELSAFSQISNDVDKSDGIEQSDLEAGDVTTVEEALAILDDIEANLKKINEHGCRADGIVKSMLQHSRGGDGEMVPTDLNALVKEYVNLSYHGMRAGKDPINVDIEMDLDESVGEIPLIAEDFSRVIVNLCGNAFDAMREKAQLRQGSVDQANGKGEAADNYLPKLRVQTQKNNGQISIKIEDNGPGIPEEIKEEILQPFFSTKQGTEGTGLGLSITNDIVKAHGGEIIIESEPNKFTSFKILLD